MFFYFPLGEDDEMSNQIRALQLGFELPRNFLNPDKYRPERIPDDDFAQVPEVVTAALFNVLDVNVPIDALNPFVYLRNGRLPEFIVAYFMQFVSRRIKSNMSRFFSAMHLIEMYREYVIVPPTHFMAALDTAAANPDANPDPKPEVQTAAKPDNQPDGKTADKPDTQPSRQPVDKSDSIQDSKDEEDKVTAPSTSKGPN